MTKILPASDEFSEVTKIQCTPWMYGIVLLVFGIIIGGIIFIINFNANDYARDVQSWKKKLNLIAESRKTDVSHFVSGNFTEMRSLADNPSLKLYLTELKMAAQEANTDKDGELSQKSYLRNLLVFTAQRSGFMPTNTTDGIPANISTENKSGLMVLNNDNEMVVGTPMVTASMMRMLELAKAQKAGEDELIDLHKDADGNIYIGFSVPIYSIQGDRNAEGQIGKIIAIKTIDQNLFSLLKQPGATEKTLEVLLLRVDDKTDKIEFLSPLQDGSEPLNTSFRLSQKDSAEEHIIKGADNFSSEFLDYRGQPVLATVRDIIGTKWKMIVKVDKAEAFFESGAHRASLVMSFTLIIALIVMIIITTWWYSHSQHALMASSYFKKVAKKAQAQENLLRLVTDYQPEAIYIIDEKQSYWFANKKVSDTVGMSPDSIIGKTVSDVRGAARAEQIAEQSISALEKGQPIYSVYRDNDDGEETIIRSGFIPLKEIPVVSLSEKTAGVLVVEQDVSEVYYERERRLTTQKQLVQMLLSLVDKRDPFAANHSLLVSKIAYQIAVDIGLDNVTIDTTQTAASLMNIGKIVVPTELLTKTGQLTKEEMTIIHSSMDASADLLENIPFDGPVAETLKQWQEKWDGTGPLGLEEENILISARIIAVANTFVGMISPRSWRDAMTIENANKFLLEQVGSYFDQRVVIAMIHYVENQSGREWLKNALKNNGKIT
ncbi:MAG: HD domain-containing phosphohydrolase [Rickettsiales bacterium]